MKGFMKGLAACSAIVLYIVIAAWHGTAVHRNYMRSCTDKRDWCEESAEDAAVVRGALWPLSVPVDLGEDIAR